MIIFTIVADRYPLPDIEKEVQALDEKEARTIFWRSLEPEQRDSTASLEVVDIRLGKSV